MHVRPLLLVFATMLASFLCNASLAESRLMTLVDHIGVSRERLERVYIDAYEQSGFHLVDRQQQDGYGDSWVVMLTFELTAASHADNVPGTMLMISGTALPTSCTPCQLGRQSYAAPDAGNPDPAVRARGQRALDLADAAALAKVRQQLGVSLPEVHGS